MKKYVLLFLALSSLSFADVIFTSGRNSNVDGHLTVGGESSASININVSAVVTEDGPAIEIVDENGNPVTAVNFVHALTAGSDLSTQQQKELTANLRIVATARNTASITAATLGRNELTLDSESDLVSTLTTTVPTNGTVTESGTSFGITSSLSGSVPESAGTYSDGATNLTITYSKQEVRH